jgi:hypothetical protein
MQVYKHTQMHAMNADLMRLLECFETHEHFETQLHDESGQVDDNYYRLMLEQQELFDLINDRLFLFFQRPVIKGLRLKS